MRNFWMTVGALGLTMLTAPAQAGVYGDDLGKCLVDKTTQADKNFLVRWIFASVSASEEVKALSTVTPEQRAQYNRDAGKLMGRLLMDDCREKTVEALKYDGPSVIETSFGLLGQVAMRGLVSDPVVAKQFELMGESLDKKRWAELLKEGGISLPAETPAH